MGCKGSGMRMSKQLVAQGQWHHQLDGIAIPSEQDVVLEDDGGPHGLEFATVQGQSA